MPNEIMIPEASALPAHIKAALAANPSLLQVNRDASEGIGAGAVPRIIANQGMFKTKIDGVETVIQMKTEMGMINAPKIAAVILKGKPTLDRAYFATAYAGGSEPVSPDCSSEDGIKPKADSPNKQCESCAGCAQNAWGSAKKSDGSPGDGKACAEKKRLAVYAANGIFRFDVPPASLKDFGAYSRQLEGHGLGLPTVITTISFDPVTPTKLVFTFHGVLDVGPWSKVEPMITSDEVKAIMQNFAAPALPQGDNSAAEAAAAKKAEDDKKAAEKKAAADKKAAEKKAKEEKEAAEKAAAAAAAGGADLGLGDLGLNLGMEGAQGEAVAAASGAEGDLSDDQLAALFAV